MTRGCLLSLYPPRDTFMARSNPAALRGVAFPQGSRLEAVTEEAGGLDHYVGMTAHYLSSPDPVQNSAPAMHNLYDDRGHGGMVQGWSEATLTEAQSGRYSAYSWSTEEGEFDKAATQRVGRMFHRLNGALYEGRGSGYQQTDRECHEWADTFPHFQVRGDHLLDSLDDGTEVVAPLDGPSTQYPADEQDTINSAESLVVVGRHIEALPLSDTPEEEALKEEVIAMDGVLEEYLAFDNSAESGSCNRQRRSCTVSSVPHRLPPVTPEACVHHAVFSQVMDLLWSEVVTILQPLVLAARDRALKEHSSRQSLQNSLATSHSTSPRESHLLLPRLSGQPPHSSAGTQHNSQYYNGKPSTSSLAAPVLPQLTRAPALSGVMQIRPVSLRHRMPAMSLMPHNEREEDMLSRLSIHHTQQQIAESAGLTQGRLAQHNLSLLQRMSDYPLPSALPSTPGGHRLISSRLNSRRPQLRPIDNPRTPALVKMEDTRIRGLKLSTAIGIGSPPPTAGGTGGGVATGGGGHVRNNQLPPLDVGTAGAGRSPPIVRGKSTFSQRNSSAFAELQELRRLQLSSRASGLELRPSTSSSIFRVESGKSLGKKLADHSSHGGMKVVGHATRVGHSNSTAATTGMEQMGSIAEDVETVEDDVRLNITGHSSGFLKPKPRSLADNRGKHRGHGR